MPQELNILQANLKALGAALASVGARSATISYRGQNDEGDISDYEVETDHEEGPGPVTYQQEAWTYVNGESIRVAKDITTDFRSVLSDVLWSAICIVGREGFENNEGGNGVLTVFPSGFGVLRHRDNFEGESEYDRQEFTAAESKYGASLASLATALREAGFKSVYAEYRGSGDSGESFDIGYTSEKEGADSRAKPRNVMYTTASREYDLSLRDFVTLEREVTSDFETAFGDVAFLYIEEVMNHRGWEINEGGGGEVSLTAEGTLNVEHYDNGETDSATNTFSWNEELATPEEREVAAAVDVSDEE